MSTLELTTIEGIGNVPVAFPDGLSASGGTANGVTYLNGSKVLTSGSALTFDGTNFGVNELTLGGSVGSGITKFGYEANISGTGTNNTAVGFYAQRTATTGTNNTAIGMQAQQSLTTGSNNVGIGYRALQSCSAGSGNTYVNPMGSGGFDPVFNITTENNRCAIGAMDLTNAYIKVAWTVVSDARDKTSIAPVPHGLAFVNQLNPVSYYFKVSRKDDTPSGVKRYGFLAQDILALEGDDPVIIDNEKPENLKYRGEALVPVLVNAIKELNAKFDAYVASHP